VFDSYAEIFAERARSYHSAMTAVPRARDAEFRAVLEPLEAAADGLVCDIPAGGCYLKRHLRPGLSYIGVEPVEDFKGADAGSGQGTVNAPLDSVPLAAGSVDHLVSLAGLHHEADLAPVFAEMRRLVRSGGRVVVADVAAGTAPARFLNGFVAEHNPLGHDGRFLDAGTAGLLEAAGLAVAADELMELPWVFAGRAEAGAFCRDLFGVAGLDSGAVADALAEVIGFDEHGRLKWMLRRIVCDAA
jgi:SAM-dependent methyltransferase